MSQPLPPTAGATPRKSALPLWLVIVLVAGAGLVVFIGILAALGIYGVKRYVMNAKTAEGRNALGVMIKGISACAAETGHLPPSSSSVPPRLESVSGKKWQSDPIAWSSDPTFACARFSMSDPQYFQYRWVLEDPENGYAQAIADFDADGTADLTLRLHARCSTDGQCVVNPTIEELR